MTLRFIGLPDALMEGTRRLLELKNCAMAETGMPVSVKSGDVLCVEIANGEAQITYPQGRYFRALGLLLEHLNDKAFSITEVPKFENLGLQIDFSRNGALRVESIKELMDMLALMGYRQLYMYMEDMYCVPNRKYFGYMRGQYTPDELKELDDYAACYDMELIPSIEVLGHMEQYLRWDEAADVRDTARELMADSEITYQFIEDMIKAVMAPLRTNKVCLNMDETHNLGLGKYLDKNGYVRKDVLFYRHLAKVFEITDSLGLECSIDSDMFFRVAAPDGGYYTKSTVIPPEIADKIPQNAALVYWHYGEEPGCDEYMIPKHVDLSRRVIFYGGTWTWSGHLPHTEYAIRATKEALPICIQYGIQDIVQTIWGDDDGMSCHHFYSLLTLQYTAEYAYGHEEDAWLAKRFNFCTDGDADAFLAMSNYQSKYKFGERSNNFMELFRGKTLFWQDVLMGQADEYLQNNPMSQFYGITAQQFEKIAQQSSKWQEHYAYIETVFRYLSLKCEIAEKLEPAYKNKNTVVLRDICNVKLPELLALTELCHAQHKKWWMKSHKPFGWETLDHHYGGMESRIRTACERIGSYLQGDVSCLEELDAVRLPMMVNPWNTVRRIATTTADF